MLVTSTARFASLALCILVLVTVAPPAPTVAAPAQHGGGSDKHPTTKLPRTEKLSFEQNQGQYDPIVQFQAQAFGGQIFFTPGEIVLALPAGKRDKPKTS